MRVPIKILFSAAFVLLAGTAFAAPAENVTQMLQAVANPTLPDWRYANGDHAGAEAVNYDDSSWKTASPEFGWGPSPVTWIRKTIVIPETIYGIPISGSRVSLRIAVDDDGIIYVNGKEASKFHWDEGNVVLTEKAVPGEKFVVAIKGLNTIGDGRLMRAYLDIDKFSALRSAIVVYLEDLEFAKTLPGDNQKVIDASAQLVDADAMKSGDLNRLSASLAKASEALDPLAAVAKGYTCHLVGHAHIDMNWLWLWPETVDVCKNTFSTVNNLMTQYPQFKFSQSQASTYVAARGADPALFETMKRRVKEGRWEITGGTWVEGDMNMASGESIVRQILYAKQYFRQNFGVEPRICWEPDTFGHAWTIPQILRKSDISYYYFMRAGKGKPLFWWEGPDGSRVLAFNDDNYNGDISDSMGVEALRMAKDYGVKDNLVVYGVGDHGGGPTRKQIDKALELQKRRLYPTLKFSTAADYFRAVEPYSKNLPVIKDELNFEFRGCYTTHSDIKKMNRTMENLLPSAEAFSSIASLSGLPYPTESFDMAWRNTCFNQFHDIFDGSAIHGSYDYSRGLYDKSFAAGKKALNGAMSHIAAKVDTRGKGYPIVVFNPLAWVRTDAVEVGSPLDVEKSGTVSVTVTDGKSQYPAQITGDKLQFTAWNIPAMGYKVFWVTSAVPKRTTSVTGTADTIENEYFRIKVERATGAISSIYDKKNRREVVPAGSKADMLQILMEEPHGMSAWNLGQFKGTTDLSHAQDSEVLEAGPSRAMVRSEHHYGDSMFVQDVILHAGVPRIDIKMTADWKAKGTPDKDIPMLKVAFPAAVTKGKATFDIPFGSIERPANGDEVPAQKWIDLSGDNYGVSLLNDCKYGHDVKDNVMRLSLLRASYDPDPIPDIGVHEMTYSIFPHTGNWRDAGTPRRAYELNNPLFAVPTKSHSGAQPKEASFLSVEPTNVIVTALKRSEDGKALIVRFYETDGKPTNAVIKTSLPIKSVVETNLMERKVGKAGAGSRKIAVTMGKNEIKTLRLGL